MASCSGGVLRDDLRARRGRHQSGSGADRGAPRRVPAGSVRDDSPLEDDGLLHIDGGVISLTHNGRRLADRVVRRHRLAERFLTDVLHLSWAEAHHEAGKWEHVLSDPVEAALNRVLGDPTTCPHGNPIPGTSYLSPSDAHRLTEVGVGGAFQVERIPEELEFTSGLLEYLEASGITPGRCGVVTAVSPDGTMTVEIDGSTVGVGEFASSRILVSG